MTDTVEPIAIIGLGARLPGALDVDEYWSNLRDGKESITFLRDEELLEAGVEPAELANRDYVKAATLVPDLKLFDADFFGMTTREAEICDPANRLFLEVAHTAIENSGYDPSNVGDGFGVFSASSPCEYKDLHLRQSLKYRSADIFQVSTLNNIDYCATWTSYKLNLRGPSMNVLTACSSSLVALHVACQSLRAGECDAAVVGGSNVEVPYGQGHLWVPGAVRSADGHCRPFDANATGTMFGSGCAAVVIKRLSTAQRDGDNIRAVIRGSAINNDGSDKVSFSAPSLAGQSSAIMEAMAMAGCHPSDISYVEAHGTATALGDPMEVAALAQAYQLLGGEDLPRDSIGLGSVKSNIGHLVWAAGVSQVVKMTLAFENEQIPPSVNFTEPNPKLQLDSTPLYVNDVLRPWPREDGKPRRAGVSSLGIGGTNAHTVMEEAPPAPDITFSERPRIVVFSARDEKALDSSRERLARYFHDNGASRFHNATATLQRSRASHSRRAAVVAGTSEEAAELLSAGKILSHDTDAPDAAQLAFLFPGQGAQYTRMAAGLHGTVPFFAETLDGLLSQFADLGLQLDEAWRSEDADALTDTRLAQPMLFSVEYALAQTLRQWGLQPTVLLGHSLGELTAATLAGVFTVEDAIRLVAARAEAMSDAPVGAMLSIPATLVNIEPHLSGSLTVSVVNTPNRVVVSGDLDEIADLETRLTRDDIEVRRLTTSHAFHCSLMAGAEQTFRDTMDTVELGNPEIPIVSAATGAFVTDEQASSPAFWAEQITKPVRFDLALDTLLTERRTLVEVGPGRTLSGLARKHPAFRGTGSSTTTTFEASTPDGREDIEQVLHAVAAAWVDGHFVDWDSLDTSDWRRTHLPAYPYQRTNVWVMPTTGPAAPKRPGGSAAENDAADRGEIIDTAPTDKPGPQTPFSTRTWIEIPAASSPPPTGTDETTALVLLPADRDAALKILGPLLQVNTRVVRVRPGDQFLAAGDEFHIRPGNASDMERMFNLLTTSDRLPNHLVHAWSATNWDPPTSKTADDQLNLSFNSLLDLIHYGTNRPVAGKVPRLLVIAGRTVDISGVEPLDPIKASLVGLTRTLAREAPESEPRVIDIGPRTSQRAIVSELATTEGRELVALRGDRRWIPDEQTFEPGPTESRLRDDGVYIITGGLGGLGLATGKALARTGRRPRLVLVGRTGLPDDPEGPAERDPAVRHVLDEIDEMENLGAQVRTMACDVTDMRQVNRVLDVTTAQFGPPDGVLHLAGVAGDGMIQFRSASEVAAVLGPKVQGTLVLEEALQGRRPLDFFVSFSSRAALQGLVGSGDYAAANAVLDALAMQSSHHHLSINWPAWSHVGMAADHGTGHPKTASHDLTLDPHDWFLDEHRLAGRPVLPGTGHLNLALKSFRALNLGNAEEGIELTDVAFHAPLVVDEPYDVRVQFAEHGEQWKFQLLSRPASRSDVDWIINADGLASSCRRSDEKHPPETMRAGMTSAVPPNLEPAPGRLFTLGPRWNCIEHVWRDDDTRKRAVHLRLSEKFAADGDEFPAHPAMLDGATAIVRDDSDGTHLPFMYERAAFHRDFPTELFSHIVRRPDIANVIIADITVAAPDGTLLAEIEGFTMRRIEHAPVDEVPGSGAATSDTPTGAPATERSESPEPDGIHPDEGGRLLVQLLSSTTPSQVHVRPFSGGRPVPLPSRTLPNTSVAGAGSTGPGSADGSAAHVLPAPARNGATTETSADAVRPAITEMWQEALGIDEAGLDDEFFDLGGDSLSSVQLMRRVRERFGLELGIGVLFDAPTIRSLSERVAELTAD